MHSVELLHVAHRRTTAREHHFAMRESQLPAAYLTRRGPTRLGPLKERMLGSAPVSVRCTLRYTRGRRIAAASARREKKQHQRDGGGRRRTEVPGNSRRGGGVSKRGLCMSRIFCVRWLPAERHLCPFGPHASIYADEEALYTVFLHTSSAKEEGRKYQRRGRVIGARRVLAFKKKKQ